uniref:Uncharacterized protein n=1 Tax=Fagus sylvatica TaxID=28930 RepID=A0A2N9FJP5_FAGSY
MEVICWGLWVAQAPNRLSLFCQYGLVSPVCSKTFSDRGCLVGIGFGDFFQFECLPNTLLLGSKPTAVLDIGCCGCS